MATVPPIAIATILITRTSLAAAFDEWARRFEEDPDQFGEQGGEGYGPDCADYLLGLLAERGTL